MSACPEFDDNRFDYVVLSSTLQAVPNVERLLEDALRVGRRAIVGFTNFAHRTLREMFGLEGRAPKPPGPYSYEWYNTPNRRFPSIRDMLELCEKMGVTVEQARYYDDTRKAASSATTKTQTSPPRARSWCSAGAAARRSGWRAPRTGFRWRVRADHIPRQVDVGVVLEVELHRVRNAAKPGFDRSRQAASYGAYTQNSSSMSSGISAAICLPLPGLRHGEELRGQDRPSRGATSRADTTASIRRTRGGIAPTRDSSSRSLRRAGHDEAAAAHVELAAGAPGWTRARDRRRATTTSLQVLRRAEAV